MKTADEILTEAAQLIRENGHIKGKFHTNEGYCLLGAVFAVVNATGWDALNSKLAVTEQVTNRIRKVIAPQVSIFSWNDAVSRSKEEVVATLEAARAVSL